MALPLASRLETAAVLARRGMLHPVRPDKLLRAGLALRRWGSTIAAAYATNAVTQPDHVAVIDDRSSLTYAEIDRRTNRLAHSLADAGVGPQKKLAILCRNGAPFIEAVVACAKLGADALPLNASFSATEVTAVLEREAPPVLIFDADFAGFLEGVKPSVPMARFVTGVQEDTPGGRAVERLISRSSNEPPDAPGEEGRTVILTSGTTGPPKGARLGRPSGLDPLAWYLSVIPLQARSTYLIAAPLFHAHGYGQMVIGAALGCTLVLSEHFHAEQSLELIARHRVEAMAVVPVMLKRIIELPPDARRRHHTGSLRAIVSSGSTLDPELARSFMETFGPVIFNLYGSTELSFATIATPRDLLEAPGTVGRAVPHTVVAVLDEHGRSLTKGEVGRIFVGSEMLFDGYTDGSASRDMSAGMMTVGDLGHLDADGRLFVDAREDDMIISGGENVYPGEVEAVLRSHPEVNEVAVVGVPDERFGQRLVAFVVPVAGGSLSAQEVAQFAREHLARFKVPREIELRDALPRNALGKVLRRELQAATRASGEA